MCYKVTVVFFKIDNNEIDSNAVQRDHVSHQIFRCICLDFSLSENVVYSSYLINYSVELVYSREILG